MGSQVGSVEVDGRTYVVVTSSNGQFIFHVQVSEIVPNYRISVQPTDDPKNVSFIHYSDVTGDTQTVITGRYKSANNISNRYFSPDVSSINIIAPCAKMRFEPEVEPEGWNYRHKKKSPLKKEGRWNYLRPET